MMYDHYIREDILYLMFYAGVAALRPEGQASDGIRRVQHPSGEGVAEKDRRLGADLLPDQVLRLLISRRTSKPVKAHEGYTLREPVPTRMLKLHKQAQKSLLFRIKYKDNPYICSKITCQRIQKV